MKNDIVIRLGTLAADADDDTKNAYIKNVVKQIAEAVGWSADSDTLYSPSGNEKLCVYTAVSGSNQCIGVAVGTRYNADADWDMWKWNDSYTRTWGCAGIQSDVCYAIITKSASGSAFALAFGTSTIAAAKVLLVCQNSDGKWWIRSLAGNSVFSFYDGQHTTKYSDICGIMDGSISYVISTTVDSPCFINVPDLVRNSTFPDVYRFIGTTGSTTTNGNTFYADGAYYKSIGDYFLLRTV